MPFNVDSANPADDSIVSQFPANERASRTQTEGWMNFEHDKVSGRHRIPAGTTSARDSQSDFVQGSLWVNTTFSPAQLQVQLNPVAPFNWVSVGSEPAGVIKAFAGSHTVVPSGYLLCNGQAVSRTVFSALFSVIGTTYGAGDGSTTFNVPDLRGRVIAGIDNMGAIASAGRLTVFTATTLGAVGGHQNMQAHQHSGTTGSENTTHTHADNFVTTTHPTGFSSGGTTHQALGYSTQQTGGQSTNHQHAFNTNTTGTGSQENVQPTMALNYIIKV